MYRQYLLHRHKHIIMFDSDKYLKHKKCIIYVYVFNLRVGLNDCYNIYTIYYYTIIKD